MLADFCLLDLLTKTGTVPGTILANNPDLFSALRLQQVTGRSQHDSLSSAEVRVKAGSEAAADSRLRYARHSHATPEDSDRQNSRFSRRLEAYKISKGCSAHKSKRKHEVAPLTISDASTLPRQLLMRLDKQEAWTYSLKLLH